MKTDNKILGNDLSKIPFEVPENYFDSFTGRLQDKIEALSSPGKVKISVLKPKPYFAYGFLIIAVTLIAYLSIKTLSQNFKSRITSEEVAAYFDLHPLEIDDVLVFDELLTSHSLNYTFQEQNDTINFLLNNNINESEIMSDL